MTTALGSEVILARCIAHARRTQDLAMLTLLGVDMSPVERLIYERLCERVDRMSKDELIAALTAASAAPPRLAKVIPIDRPSLANSHDDVKSSPTREGSPREDSPTSFEIAPVAASPAPVQTYPLPRDPGP